MVGSGTGQGGTRRDKERAAKTLESWKKKLFFVLFFFEHRLPFLPVLSPSFECSVDDYKLGSDLFSSLFRSLSLSLADRHQIPNPWVKPAEVFPSAVEFVALY